MKVTLKRSLIGIRGSHPRSEGFAGRPWDVK